MSDTKLFDKALARYRRAAGTDWKKPLARIYARYERADDDADRRRIEDQLVDAFMPMAAFLSLKHSRPGVGFTAPDAFEAGVVALPAAFRKFDPEMSSIGRRGLLSFAAQYFEWECIHARNKCSARAAVGISSLDALESMDAVPALAEEDVSLARVDQSGGVRRVVSDAIANMAPVDSWLATRHLLDGMSMRMIEERGSEVGQDVSRETWRWRWSTRVRPQLQDALEKAGFGPEDIDNANLYD